MNRVSLSVFLCAASLCGNSVANAESIADAESVSDVQNIESANPKSWKNLSWGLSWGKPIYAGIGFAKNNIALITGVRSIADVTTRMSADDSDSASQLLLGMHYSEKFDLEARFQNLGSYKHSTQIVDAPQQIQTNIETDLEYRALSVLLRPKYALGKLFEVQAELGMAYIMAERSPSALVFGNQAPAELQQLEEDINADLDDKSNGKLAFTYGFGFLYQWKGRYAWRYGLALNEHGDEEFSSHSVSLIRRFGE